MYTSFGEVSVKVFGPFLTSLLVFVNPFIFWISPISDCLFQIFSYSLWLVFSFSYVVCGAEVFYFDEVQIITVS